MRDIVITAGAPSSPLFSPAVRAGALVLVSGTTGVDPETGRMAGPTIQEQTGQALANCRAILTEAGCDLDDVVDVGVLLAEPDDFAGLNEEWARWFPETPPARWVARLGPTIPGLLVSLRMTAYREGLAVRPS